MRRLIAVPLLTAALLFTAGCSQSYDDKVKACSSAMHEHDFDAHPLAEGQRLPACKDIKEKDYTAIVGNNVLGDLGWLDDDGNFDENKMRDSVTN